MRVNAYANLKNAKNPKNGAVINRAKLIGQKTTKKNKTLKMTTKPEESTQVSGPSQAPITEKTITLPSGKKATIKVGKGKHMRAAIKIAGDDPDKYNYALMAVLTTIDGQPIVLEDLDEMPLKDVSALQVEFADLNF